MRAMIVDDSRPIRRIAQGVLREMGFETAEACDGRDALEQLGAGLLPDVVLVDWNMPEMDGLELVRTLRSDPKFSGLVIVMITTETEPDQMLRALSAGVDEYLMKPFLKEGLADKLRLVGVLR
jgi:two-component system chemotaxis response regulator CheY